MKTQKETKKERCLHKIFGVPPLSQLDCKQKYWKDLRKKLNSELNLNSDKGRDAELLKLSPLLKKKQKGTSIFDPVLAHCAYMWFSKEKDTVFDPFCGGTVRGLVASKMLRKYIGVDIREEQVEENKSNISDIEPAPRFILSDAVTFEAPEHDLFFTCPPYLDLEKYSNLPGDLSNMSHSDFWVAYEAVIGRGLAKLHQDRFAVIVVGDVRGPDGFYVGLPRRTIEIFQKYGAKLYNDAIYLQEPVTAAMRAFKSMNDSRKMPKAHQNFLVFCKGDALKASKRLQKFQEEEEEEEKKEYKKK